MEKALISIVANGDCIASQNWLGRLSPASKIQTGKLWNVEDLNSKTTVDNLEQLLYDGLVLKCDISKEFKDFLKD